MENENNFSNEALFNESFKRPEPHHSVALLTIKVAITFTTSSFNLLIVIVILRSRDKTYSNILYGSMALADFLIGSISIPFMTVFSTLDYWPLGDIACIIWNINDVSCSAISLLSLLLLSIHRFWQVKSPLCQHDKLTKIRISAVTFLWCSCFSLWTSIIVIFAQGSLNHRNCIITYPIIFIFIAEVLGIIMPIGAIIFFVVLAFYTLKQKVKSFAIKISMNSLNSSNYSIAQKSSSTPTELAASQSASRTTLNLNTSRQFSRPGLFRRIFGSSHKDRRTLLCIILMCCNLIVCWALFIVAWPMSVLCFECLHERIYEISAWGPLIFSTMNPIIMLAFNHRLRQSSKDLINSIVHKLFLRS